MVSLYLQNIKKQGSSTRMTLQIFMHYKEEKETWTKKSKKYYQKQRGKTSL